MCKHGFSSCLGSYLEMELLVCIFLKIGDSVCWKFVWSCQTILQSSCTVLESQRQCLKPPVSSHYLQHLFSKLTSRIAVLLVVWGRVIVTLMTGDTELCVMCLLAICISFEKYTFKSLAHFLEKQLLFYWWVVIVLYALDM